MPGTDSSTRPSTAKPVWRRNLELAATVVVAICGVVFIGKALKDGDLRSWALAGFYTAITLGALATVATTNYAWRHGRKAQIADGVAALASSIAAFASGAGGFMIFLGVITALLAASMIFAPSRRA